MGFMFLASLAVGFFSMARLIQARFMLSSLTTSSPYGVHVPGLTGSWVLVHGPVDTSTACAFKLDDFKSLGVRVLGLINRRAHVLGLPVRALIRGP